MYEWTRNWVASVHYQMCQPMFSNHGNVYFIKSEIRSLISHLMQFNKRR
jgi:hypothetical protein